MGWEIAVNSELLAAFVFSGEGVTVLPITPGQPTAGFGIGANVEPYGLASVTPYISPSFRKPIGPIPPPPPVPVTTVFVLNGYAYSGTPASVLAVAPSLDETAPLTTAIILPSGLGPQQNGLAVYQQAIPPNELYFGPSLPIYIYVLCTAPDGSGETVLRYQMNSSPVPYQPAGLTGNPTDPTFIPADLSFSVGNGHEIQLLKNYALIQGLACSADGTLAVSAGSLIWLFDAETGEGKGAAVIVLNELNLAAFTLAFGPDGNLYVLAGPPLADPSANGPDSITILKFVGSTGMPWSGPNGSPVLIPTTQLGTGNTEIAMTVGGTSTAPILYVGGVADQFGNGTVLTFDGVTGVAGSSFTLGLQEMPDALAVVDIYSLERTFPIPLEERRATTPRSKTSPIKTKASRSKAKRTKKRAGK